MCQVGAPGTKKGSWSQAPEAITRQAGYDASLIALSGCAPIVLPVSCAVKRAGGLIARDLPDALTPGLAHPLTEPIEQERRVRHTVDADPTCRRAS